MNIKQSVYDNLTPCQRLIATVEALARGDKVEHEKLANTCPQKNYRQADYQYAGTMQVLMSTAFYIEQTLTSNALSMILSHQYGMDEQEEIFLQRIVDTYAAWNQHLEVMGIDPRAMDEIIKDMRHPFVNIFLKADFGKVYSEVFVADERTKKEWAKYLGNFFKKFYSA